MGAGDAAARTNSIYRKIFKGQPLRFSVPPPLPPHPCRSGFALILALFLLALLASIVTPFAFRTQVGLSAAAHRAAALQHEMAIKAGVVQAMRVLRHDLAADGLVQFPYDGLDEGWAEPIEIAVGPATVRVAIRDAKSMLRINDMVTEDGLLLDLENAEDPKDRLYRLFTLIPDKDVSDADLFEALVDWVDRAPEGHPETGRFEENAKNAPLYTLRELLLVPGFSRETLYGFRLDDGSFAPGLASFCTARWGDGSVNPNTAPFEVLLALSPNMTPAFAETLLRTRAATPFTSVQHVANTLPDWPGMIAEIGPLLSTKSDFFLLDVTSEIGKSETSRGTTRHALSHVARDANGGQILAIEFD